MITFFSRFENVVSGFRLYQKKTAQTFTPHFERLHNFRQLELEIYKNINEKPAELLAVMQYSLHHDRKAVTYACLLPVSKQTSRKQTFQPLDKILFIQSGGWIIFTFVNLLNKQVRLTQLQSSYDSTRWKFVFFIISHCRLSLFMPRCCSKMMLLSINKTLISYWVISLALSALNINYCMCTFRGTICIYKTQRSQQLASTFSFSTINH